MQNDYFVSICMYVWRILYTAAKKRTSKLKRKFILFSEYAYNACAQSEKSSRISCAFANELTLSEYSCIYVCFGK